MPLFEVRKSLAAGAFSRPPETVDVGVCVKNFQSLTQHSDIAVLSLRLGSDQAIDKAINQLIAQVSAELEDLRSTAKELLATLKA